MKERPILFTGEMVRAIIDGRKTQTRCIMKPQPLDGCTVGWSTFSGENRVECRSYAIHHQSFIKVPFGKRGDRLWVKETFQMAHEMGVCHKKDSYPIFRASDPDWEKTDGWKWKPSIFMPRRASRITLEITAIRVERLQDISEADAIAEGVRLNSTTHWATEARDAYRALWESINGKGSWDKNPWVWVIEFKKI